MAGKEERERERKEIERKSICASQSQVDSDFSLAEIDEFLLNV